jgi:hypothetical protein
MDTTQTAAFVQTMVNVIQVHVILLLMHANMIALQNIPKGRFKRIAIANTALTVSL